MIQNFKAHAENHKRNLDAASDTQVMTPPQVTGQLSTVSPKQSSKPEEEQGDKIQAKSDKVIQPQATGQLTSKQTTPLSKQHTTGQQGSDSDDNGKGEDAQMQPLPTGQVLPEEVQSYAAGGMSVPIRHEVEEFVMYCKANSFDVNAVCEYISHMRQCHVDRHWRSGVKSI